MVVFDKMGPTVVVYFDLLLLILGACFIQKSYNMLLDFFLNAVNAVRLKECDYYRADLNPMKKFLWKSQSDNKISMM